MQCVWWVYGTTTIIILYSKKSGDFVKTAVHDFTGDQTYVEMHGHRFKLNADFDSVRASDYDGLYLPGGRAPEWLRTDERVLNLVKHFLDAKKPMAVLCHGPQILAAIPGALKGRKITAYFALKADMVNAGAHWVDTTEDKVVVDGHLVTGVAWPGHSNLISEFLKLLGTKIEL